MKLFYKNIFLFPMIFIIFVGVTDCNPPELKITSIELCENFNSEGICREPLQKAHTYNLTIVRSKKFETWESLSNYMYFHSRQTPGFIVRFNRKFTMTERDLLHKSYKANYTFYGSSGTVEGFEVGEDWVGSFQYLGSIIKDRQRHFKEEKNFPYMETLFPANLNFSFDSALGKGEISSELNVILQYKE